MRIKKAIDENTIKGTVKRWLTNVRAWHYAPIQTGMGVHGIPDRIACMPIVVTPEMVGKTIGLFVAVESKRPGRRNEPNAGATVHQVNHLTDIIEAGGVAGLADCEEDVGALYHETSVIATCNATVNSRERLLTRLNERIKRNG